MIQTIAVLRAAYALRSKTGPRQRKMQPAENGTVPVLFDFFGFFVATPMVFVCFFCAFCAFWRPLHLLVNPLP